MRTTYPQAGFREHPKDLIRRFGSRLGVFRALAWSTIEIRDLAERAAVDVDLEMPIEMAHAIIELWGDYQDLSEALLARDWIEPEPDVQAVIV